MLIYIIKKYKKIQKKKLDDLKLNSVNPCESILMDNTTNNTTKEHQVWAFANAN